MKKVSNLFWVNVGIFVLGLLPFGYGFFVFLKYIVTASALYYAYQIYEKSKFSFLFFMLSGLAILYNPFAPIYLYEKGLWIIINIITLVAFYKAEEIL